MCLAMFVTIVLVIALSSIDASTNLTSAEVCQQIRTSQLSILTMGSRGHHNPAKHRFYLLTEFGYLFVVPFANLKVDLQTKRARLTIDTDYKDASQLYNEPRTIFTAKPGNGAYQIFYLLTIDKYEHKFYLMREYGNSSNTCYYFYYLILGGKFSRAKDCDNGINSYEHFGMNVESSEHYAKNTALFYSSKAQNGSKPNKIWEYDSVYTMDFTVEQHHYLDTLVFTTALNSTILTAFYVGVNGHDYTVLLSDNGRVIVGENAFEVSLSDFIECNFPSNNSPFPWIWVIGSVVVITLGGCALYLVIKKRRQRQSNLSSQISNANSSLWSSNYSSKSPSAFRTTPTIGSSPNSKSTSKFYTSINMITSKISSLFQRNAKSVAKANKAKDKTKANKSKLNKAKVAKKKKKDDDKTKK